MNKPIIILLLLLAGCSANIKSTVIWEDGSVVEVHSKSDSVVSAKKGDDEITVDNRGRPSFLETILGGWIVGGQKK